MSNIAKTITKTIESFDINFGKVINDAAEEIKSNKKLIDFKIKGVEDVTLRVSNEGYECLYDVARRPCYAIRGVPITPEQAREIIIITDPNIGYSKKADNGYFYNNWAEPLVDSRHSNDIEAWGWCHPDGYIGLNHYMYEKNPFADELLYPWIQLAHYVDYLDVVVAVTIRNERIERIDSTGETSFDPFEEAIVGGIRVKGKLVEVLNDAKARLLFRRYDKLYGKHDIKNFHYYKEKSEDKKHSQRLIGDEIIGNPEEQGLVQYQKDEPEWIAFPYLFTDDMRRSGFSGKPVFNLSEDKYYFKADRNSPAYTGYPDEEYKKKMIEYLGIINLKPIIKELNDVITPKNNQILRLIENRHIDIFMNCDIWEFPNVNIIRGSRLFLVTYDPVPRLMKNVRRDNRERLYLKIFAVDKDDNENARALFEKLEDYMQRGFKVYEYDTSSNEIRAIIFLIEHNEETDEVKIIPDRLEETQDDG